MIEGEAEEADPAPEPEKTPEAKPADPAADAAMRRQPSPKATAAQPAALPDHLESLLDRIRGELTDVTNPDLIDPLIEMFGDVIEKARAESPAFGKALDEEIAAFRKGMEGK